MFGAGITLAQLQFNRTSTGDLLVRYGSAGQDCAQVRDWSDAPDHQIEQLLLPAGTAITNTQINAMPGLGG